MKLIYIFGKIDSLNTFSIRRALKREKFRLNRQRGRRRACLINKYSNLFVSIFFNPESKISISRTSKRIYISPLWSSSAAFPPDRAFHPAPFFVDRTPRRGLASNFIHLRGAQKASRNFPYIFWNDCSSDPFRSEFRLSCAHDGFLRDRLSKGKIWRKSLDLEAIDQLLATFCSSLGIWICAGEW